MAILKCDCKNEQMDKAYGVGKRVCNKTGKEPPTYRCVVCGEEHSKGSADTK